MKAVHACIDHKYILTCVASEDAVEKGKGKMMPYGI